MKMSEIKNMTVVERLRTMENIWESFSVDPVDIKSPSWHEGVVTGRKAKLATGKAKLISLDELKQRR